MPHLFEGHDSNGPNDGAQRRSGGDRTRSRAAAC